MVSRDEGRTWETLSTPPAFLHFAVSPTDPGSLVALTVEGALASHDGGLSWQPLPAPALVLIDWPDQLWGVDEAGEVYVSADEGRSWEPRGTLPGEPEAILVVGSELLAAVRGSGIFVSTDAGQTWSPRYMRPETS
jgi:photosystem II stability/assembly factor-like uncharacterized protein